MLKRLSCYVYLNNVSLLLHTRFRTTSFQQNNPTSTKMPESKTLCSICEVTLAEDLKAPFVTILLSLCPLVSSFNAFLLYRTTEASLLSPQTTSIQNPILQIKERRKLTQAKQPIESMKVLYGVDIFCLLLTYNASKNGGCGVDRGGRWDEANTSRLEFKLQEMSRISVRRVQFINLLALFLYSQSSCIWHCLILSI